MMLGLVRGAGKEIGKIEFWGTIFAEKCKELRTSERQALCVASY